MGNPKGVMFSILCVFSSTFGTLVFLPCLILLSFLDPRVGRRALDFMIWLWTVYCVRVESWDCRRVTASATKRRAAEWKGKRQREVNVDDQIDVWNQLKAETGLQMNAHVAKLLLESKINPVLHGSLTNFCIKNMKQQHQLVLNRALYENVCGVKVVISGEPAPEDDGTLIVMNHRTRFDWMFLFSYQMRCASLSRLKISLKESLKYMPGPGWAMQIAGYLFLQRKWEVDQHTIAKCMSYFGKLKEKPQILLFPEGTNMSKYTKEKSHIHAKCNDLEIYDYVLHPRTKGFAYFVQQMRKNDSFDSVADITIGYTKNIPENESDILKGDFPKEIHFHVQKCKGRDLPTSTEDLESWCKNCWKRKEQRLKEFYVKNSFGDGVKNGLQKDEKRVQSLFRFALMFWTLFELAVIWMLYYHPLFRWYSVILSVIFIAISRLSQLVITYNPDGLPGNRIFIFMSNPYKNFVITSWARSEDKTTWKTTYCDTRINCDTGIYSGCRL